jgi:hypothetical protein
VGSKLALIAVVLASLFAVQLLLTNRAGSNDEISKILATVRPSAWYFVALEYYSGISNRTLVVFVTEKMICGAEVGGLLVAPVVVTERWHDPLFYPRPGRLARYGGLDVESEAFSMMSKGNFRLRREQIASVEFTDEEKWGMGKVPYSGRLLVSLTDGAKKELILLGRQDGLALRLRLRAGGFGA